MESGQSLVKAQWGDRLIAEVVDAIAWGLISLPTSIGTIIALSESSLSASSALAVGFGLVLTLGALALVAAQYRDGQSVGKRIVGTQVVYADAGAPLSWGANFIVRSILVKGVVVSTAASITFGVFYLLNYLWPLWDKNRQTLHDKMLSTYVVLKPKATAQSSVFTS